MDTAGRVLFSLGFRVIGFRVWDFRVYGLGVRSLGLLSYGLGLPVCGVYKGPKEPFIFVGLGIMLFATIILQLVKELYI